MFFEVGIDSKAFEAAGFFGRDEVEDPLDDLLRARDLGEVTGGGGGSGRMNIDVEMAPHLEAETAAVILLSMLEEVGAPKKTTVTTANPERRSWSLGTPRASKAKERIHSAGSNSLEVSWSGNRVSFDLWVAYRRLFLRDASMDATKPPPLRDEITASAVSICIPVSDGAVRVSLWQGGRTRSGTPQYDGPLRLPSETVVLASLVCEEFYCLPLKRGLVRARIWTNAPLEPDKVWIQLSNE